MREHIGLKGGDQQLEPDQHDVDRLREEGADARRTCRPPASITMKLANTSNITWPAIMLANRRTGRLTGRDR